MYPEVHKVSKRLRAPEEVEEDDREGSQDKREDKETAKYPISATSDHGRRPGYLLKTVSHPCGLKVTDRLTDVSVDVLPVLAGTVLVRAVSCPGSHPTVDRLVVACGPPDWVGALKRVQGESCPGLHPTVDPHAGWPKASDEHVLKQTALTPSFARGSRLQTTPKGRKAKAT